MTLEELEEAIPELRYNAAHCRRQECLNNVDELIRAVEQRCAEKIRAMTWTYKSDTCVACHGSGTCYICGGITKDDAANLIDPEVTP